MKKKTKPPKITKLNKRQRDQQFIAHNSALLVNRLARVNKTMNEMSKALFELRTVGESLDAALNHKNGGSK